MSDMVERVARAMFNRPGWEDLDEEVIWEGGLMPSKRWWRVCAQFAIDAMRELSSEEIERAAEALRDYETKDASGVVPWRNLNEKIKQHFRGKVRVVVDSIEVAE